MPILATMKLSRRWGTRFRGSREGLCEGELVVLGFAEGFDDVAGQSGEAEEDACRDGGGDGVVGVEGDGGDEAGGESGSGVGVHQAACPDGEVAEDKEGRGRGGDCSDDAEGGGLFAEDLVAHEADGCVPDPGDEVGAGVPGVSEGEDGEVVVGGYECEDGDDGLPAAAARAKVEQTAPYGGESQTGGAEGVGQDAAKNSKEKDEISSHGRPQCLEYAQTA